MSEARLLLLSASTGNGHLAASRAIHQEAKSRGIPVESVDCLDYAPRLFQAWFRGGYELLVRRKPAAWGRLYAASDRPRLSYHFQTALDQAFVRRIERLMVTFRPTWVVCTHSLPQPRLARLRRRYGFKVAIVVTDLYPHRMWLRGRPDLYFVPSDWSAAELRHRLGDRTPETIVSGIPVSREFREDTPWEPLWEDLGVAPGPSVLLSSGGIGGGPLAQAAQALARVPAQVIAVCGRNESARRELSQLGIDNLKVLGHVTPPQMAALMRGSSMIVGKPGGLTTSEALVAGLPFVVYDPFMIPGQEEQNGRFLNEVGAGVSAPGPESLANVVDALLRDDARRGAMRSAARTYGRPTAAATVVDRLIQLA